MQEICQNVKHRSEVVGVGSCFPRSSATCQFFSTALRNDQLKVSKLHQLRSTRSHQYPAQHGPLCMNSTEKYQQSSISYETDDNLPPLRTAVYASSELYPYRSTPLVATRSRSCISLGDSGLMISDSHFWLEAGIHILTTIRGLPPSTHLTQYEADGVSI